MKGKTGKKTMEYIIILGSIISELDNLRRGLYVSPKKIDSRVNKLPFPRVKSIWKKGRKEILGLEVEISREKRFREYIKWSVFLRNLSIISISFIGFSFALFYTNSSQFSFLIDFVTKPIVALILVVIIPNAYFVMDYMARHYIKDHFARIKVEERKRLKTVINELLDILVSQIRKNDINEEKIKIKIFYTDYNNIKIIKKPNIFRKYYIVIPSV